MKFTFYTFKTRRWGLSVLVLMMACSSGANLPAQPQSRVLQSAAEPAAYSSQILQVGETTTVAEKAAAHEHKQGELPYVCPMHPEVQSDKPGKCPKCGMKLVPREPKKQPEPRHDHH